MCRRILSRRRRSYPIEALRPLSLSGSSHRPQRPLPALPNVHNGSFAPIRVRPLYDRTLVVERSFTGKSAARESCPAEKSTAVQNVAGLRAIHGATNTRVHHRRVHHDRHCKRRRRRFTAVMRHFLRRCAWLRPCRRRDAAQSGGSVLRRGCRARHRRCRSARPVRTPAAALVTRSGCPLVLPPLLARAVPGTVNMAVIAVAANADRYPAAPALVSPVSLLPHRNAIPLEDWTMPCGRCIKNPWRCLTHAPHRGPGVDRRSLPGPSPLRPQRLSIAKIGRTGGVKRNGRQRAAALITPPVTASIPLR